MTPKLHLLGFIRLFCISVHYMLGETSIQQFLVLVSLDTKSKDPQQIPLSEASQGLKSKGINVYSVGVKPSVDQQDLEDTTTKPSNVYIIPSDQLANTGKRIADTIKGYVGDPSRQTGQYHRSILTLKVLHDRVHYRASLNNNICTESV